MIPKFVTLLALTFFLSVPSYAVNTPIMAFKDFKMSSPTRDSLEVTYKKENFTIQRIDALRFKLNNQNIILDSSDTYENIQNKIQRAYKASNKRSAALDQLFIPKANAAPPMLFSMLFGGILGLGIGRATCDRGNNPAPAAESAYVTPESAQ